jgi:hypothetical protein
MVPSCAGAGAFMGVWGCVAAWWRAHSALDGSGRTFKWINCRVSWLAAPTRGRSTEDRLLFGLSSALLAMLMRYDVDTEARYPAEER